MVVKCRGDFNALFGDNLNELLYTIMDAKMVTYWSFYLIGSRNLLNLTTIYTLIGTMSSYKAHMHFRQYSCWNYSRK